METLTAVEGKEDTPLLGEMQTRVYRSIIGRLLWSVPVRPDLGFAVRELARHVAAPREASWARLKRVVRYLRGTDTEELHLRLGALDDVGGPDEISVVSYSDASWAGCPGYRSVTAGVLIADGVLLTHFSRTQAVQSLSSTEAELLALTMVSQETILALTIFKNCR